MNYTDKMKTELRPILTELVSRINEIKQRKDQPTLNKGLDAICDYDEAIEKILNKTAAPDMYNVLHLITTLGLNETRKQMAEAALNKAEEKS